MGEPLPGPASLAGLQEALDGAVLRGHQPALAYVREDGSPAATFRGSTHVHGPTELAIWVRKRDDGFAQAITKEPRVSLVYADFGSPGVRYLAIEGRASARPELDDEVYKAIVEPEREQDSDKKGIAVVIEVYSARGFGPSGYFEQHRD